MRSKLKWTMALFMVLFVQLSFAQEKTLSGVVTEAGMSLPGATVIIQGTQNGTQTDLDGQYSINVKPGDVLVFSFIGLDDVTYTVGAANTHNVTMTAGEEMLEEVTVTAFGIKRSSKSLGYATQEVKGDALNKTSNTSLSGALQGKLAGVSVTPSSGAPGASSQIMIRGARSFTGDNTPLYVIDGMPVSSTADFSTGNSTSGSDVANRAVDIDPSDIESISVLKGQAASALYGLRASNGVILITTKSGKGLEAGKPVVSYNTTTSFEKISRKPDLQNIYAQGTNGKFDPYESMSWGPKISELPNDAGYGGNTHNQYTNGTLRPGKYYVPQREIMGLDPWVTPQAYDNVDDYFRTGHTISHNLNVSQSTGKSNYSFGFGTSTQEGMMPGTGMDRYSLKLNANTKLNDEWNTGFSANYVQTKIDKATSANDSSLPGVYGAPASYDLKGIGYADPTNPYKQVFFRKTSFNNPYWAAENNEFSEKTNRFYGNAFVEYAPKISIDQTHSLTFKYQVGLDSYTTNYRDFFEYGNGHTGKGSIDLNSYTKDVVNSLLTVNYNWDITDDLRFDVLAGTEFNHENYKNLGAYGNNLNFGGWGTIENASIVSSVETRNQERTVGFFSNAGLSYADIIFLSGSIRKDITSTMPRGARSFVYPSVSLGLVLTGIEGLNQSDVVSFAKIRGSYAHVGQAGTFKHNYYSAPSYGGGFWGSTPIQYPLGGVNAYVPYALVYDPNLTPQNTKSFEIGADVRFFNNRLGIDYTFSEQNAKDQIFQVPLAGSSGKASIVTNGGHMQTIAHELVVFATPIQTKDFEWNINANFSKVTSKVEELKDGLDLITLGGFVQPQIRISAGENYPVIFGNSFKRHENGQVLIDENGLPMVGDQKVLGSVMPDFTVGGGMDFRYKNWNLGAVVEWQNGGMMYSGTNKTLGIYGMSGSTEDRDQEMVFEGVKADGTPNDIAVGGSSSTSRYALESVLNNITENSVYDASFVKLREVTLGYTFPKLIDNKLDLRVSAFARNILLWSKIPNVDPESSQGNNNMAGGFEHWSVPQAQSFGMSLNVVF